MKQAHISIAVLAAWLLTAPAAAQENPVYFGIKAGEMDADARGFGESTNFGLLLGYALVRDAGGTFSLESEYTRRLSKGDVAGGGNWHIETLALYGAFRTADRVYLKAKVGARQQEVKCGGVSRALCGKDSGVSFGAGAGWRLNRKVGFEIEYTVIESDVGFLSIGYFTHF